MIVEQEAGDEAGSLAPVVYERSAYGRLPWLAFDAPYERGIPVPPFDRPQRIVSFSLRVL